MYVERYFISIITRHYANFGGYVLLFIFITSFICIFLMQDKNGNAKRSKFVVLPCITFLRAKEAWALS